MAQPMQHQATPGRGHIGPHDDSFGPVAGCPACEAIATTGANEIEWLTPEPRPSHTPAPGARHNGAHWTNHATLGCPGCEDEAAEGDDCLGLARGESMVCRVDYIDADTVRLTRLD